MISNNLVTADMDEFKGRPLGRVLIKMGKITRAQVQEAIEIQRNRHELLGQILIRLGYVTEADVQRALAAQAGN